MMIDKVILNNIPYGCHLHVYIYFVNYWNLPTISVQDGTFFLVVAATINFQVCAIFSHEQRCLCPSTTYSIRSRKGPCHWNGAAYCHQCCSGDLHFLFPTIFRGKRVYGLADGRFRSLRAANS